jgi:hypothetical protein
MVAAQGGNRLSAYLHRHFRIRRDGMAPARPRGRDGWHSRAETRTPNVIQAGGKNFHARSSNFSIDRLPDQNQRLMHSRRYARCMLCAAVRETNCVGTSTGCAPWTRRGRPAPLIRHASANWERRIRPHPSGTWVKQIVLPIAVSRFKIDCAFATLSMISQQTTRNTRRLTRR